MVQLRKSIQKGNASAIRITYHETSMTVYLGSVVICGEKMIPFYFCRNRYH